MSRLYTLFIKRSKMSVWNKLTLYKTCIRPIMIYACIVFAHTKIDFLKEGQILLWRSFEESPKQIHPYGIRIPMVHMQRGRTQRFWIWIVKGILQTPSPALLRICRFPLQSTYFQSVLVLSSSSSASSTPSHHPSNEPDDQITVYD